MPNPTQNPSSISRKGYDAAALTYNSWTTSQPSSRLLWLNKLLSLLTPPPPATLIASNPNIVELGCGAGIPTTLHIAQQAGRVSGFDISETQISLARQHFEAAGLPADASNPAGQIQLEAQDMLDISLDDSIVDAVCAFYSIIHLSVKDQQELLRRVHGWLMTGGYVLFNVGTERNLDGNVKEDWHGMAAYWASLGGRGTEQALKEIGFEVVEMEREIVEGDGDFTWFIARKPSVG
jgi:SAM-dependent methyltransferase